jgi:hypothetical protein
MSRKAISITANPKLFYPAQSLAQFGVQPEQITSLAHGSDSLSRVSLQLFAHSVAQGG